MNSRGAENKTRKLTRTDQKDNSYTSTTGNGK